MEGVRTMHKALRVGRLYNTAEKEMRVGFDNRYVTYNSNSMESIEAPSREHAEKILELSKQLRHACGS